MNHPPAPLFLDDRAGSVDLARYEPFRSCGELTRLDFGDVLIVGNGAAGNVLVSVEVKSVWDLLSSMNTGRLQGTQLPGLIRTSDYAALLYYGQTRLGRDGVALEIMSRNGWRTMKLGKRVVPYGYLEAFLWDVALLGIHVQRVDDERTAAAWLGVLHRWWSKPWTAHKGLRTLDRSRDVGLMPNMDSRMLQRCKVASQLPGIGFEKAVNAANHFESVREMINASADDWCAVAGVGKVIGKAVVEAVR